MNFLNVPQYNLNVNDFLSNNLPLFVSRPGGTENQILMFTEENISSFASDEDMYFCAKKHAGITANNNINELRFFAKAYYEALCSASHIGVWYPNNTKELNIFSRKLYERIGNKTFTNLETLMPWWALHENSTPWSLGLKGKRVLVAHPFVKSFSINFNNKNNINIICDILPDFELSFIMPPVTNGETQEAGVFSEHLDDFKNRLKIFKDDFDVLIIGAGAYGAIVGNYAYTELNKTVFHLGGATQLLFGVAGRRWLEAPFYKEKYANIIDSTWTRPFFSEQTPGFQKLEAGCYW
jgi:hypothetical protein